MAAAWVYSETSPNIHPFSSVGGFEHLVAVVLTTTSP